MRAIIASNSISAAQIPMGELSSPLDPLTGILEAPLI